jgi:hypothetical protein
MPEFEDEDYAEYLDAVAENVEDFEELYGFSHDCHCKEDWDEGDVGIVSRCYTEMVNDALTQCNKFKGMTAEQDRIILLLQMQVRELGAEPRV